MLFKVSSRLQLKYILSYMLIFLVPFSIMAFIFYQNSVSSLRDEIELSNMNNLNNIKTLTDSRLKEMEKTASLISYNPKLAPYMIEKNEFQSEAIKQLEKYKETSSIIRELYLFYQNHTLVYSSKGLMSKDIFLKNRSSFQRPDQALLANEIMKADSPQSLPILNYFPISLYFCIRLPPNQEILMGHYYYNWMRRFLKRCFGTPSAALKEMYLFLTKTMK